MRGSQLLTLSLPSKHFTFSHSKKKNVNSKALFLQTLKLKVTVYTCVSEAGMTKSLAFMLKEQFHKFSTCFPWFQFMNTCV